MVEENIGEHCEKVNQLLLEIIKNQRYNFRKLERIFVITIISLTIIICGMIGCFTWYESQYETVEKLQTEITQEVSGEDGTINNVTGNQYNDNAIHNEDK